MPQILTVREAAQYLRLSQGNLYKLKAQNKVPFHRIGDKIVFIQEELLEWVKNDGKCQEGKE